MKHFKTLLLILAASFMLVACGSGGGSSDGDGGGDAGSVSGSASGQITGVDYDAQEIIFSINSSNFPACGPQVGTDDVFVSDLNATTMIWPTEGLTWTRSPGDPEDIVGTWKTSGNGVSLTLTIKNDYSFTLTGSMSCD